MLLARIHTSLSPLIDVISFQVVGVNRVDGLLIYLRKVKCGGIRESGSTFALLCAKQS